MAGSNYGTIFQITTWGESHGAALGVVVDGCPSGLFLTKTDIQTYLDRRKPGQSAFATPRKESDTVSILSGTFEGKTTGTPISMLIPNTSQHSSDYAEIASYYRPGHADFTFDQKYGFRDYRGGGRSSGRETASRVAGGAVALKILQTLGIQICAYTKSIGEIPIDYSCFDASAILETPTAMPDRKASILAEQYLTKLKEEKDSCGGVIECIVTGLPYGIGEPVFDKLDACLAKAVLSIGAIKAIEFGDGIEASQTTGSKNNDSFHYTNGILSKKTNHAGGILGGLSDGSELIFRAFVKPTPSIFQEQETINKEQKNITVSIKGRHDPVIVPRAVVVVESMAAVTILDLLLQNMTSTLSGIQKFYAI